MSLPIFIVIGIAVLMIGVTIFFYNRLARSKVKVNEAWSGIKIQLKKRRDLVERLEGVVKSSSGYDQELIKNLTRTRYDSEVARAVPQQAGAEMAFVGALHRILDHVTPSLTADESFQSLRKAIEKTEEEVEMSRRYYNAVVREHNTRCTVFPSSLFANLLKMQQFEFFGESSE